MRLGVKTQLFIKIGVICSDIGCTDIVEEVDASFVVDAPEVGTDMYTGHGPPTNQGLLPIKYLIPQTLSGGPIVVTRDKDHMPMINLRTQSPPPPSIASIFGDGCKHVIISPGSTVMVNKLYFHSIQVVNKWLALQAISDIPGNVENVKGLLNHPAFDLRNPNKVYSLIGGFVGSPVNFHSKDGSGYKFLGEIVLQLDKINPQVCILNPSVNYEFLRLHISAVWFYLICSFHLFLSVFLNVGCLTNGVGLL